jgi:hypothetical protein
MERREGKERATPERYEKVELASTGELKEVGKVQTRGWERMDGESNSATFGVVFV